MTTQEIQDLRKMYLPGRFREYREALREEARRLGHKVGANDIIKVLEEREAHPDLYPTMADFMPRYIQTVNAFELPQDTLRK